MSIKVKNLSFTYLPNTPNSYEALRNVSFEIEEGKQIILPDRFYPGKQFVEYHNDVVFKGV